MSVNNTVCKENVAFIYDNRLCTECNRLPTMENRASIVLDLINSYGLLNLVTVEPSLQATEDDLRSCHSSLYVDFLKSVNNSDDLEEFESQEDEFGLGYDCPILEKMLDFCKTIAGGSLTASNKLINGNFKVAINWFGGWHHAQRDSAEGFCYINDCAIAIQKLSEHFNRVLYVDLDIHHGNGVQNIFEISKKVLTLSFHKYVPGFYPGSGSLHDLGYLKGKYYSLNVPLLEGISDDSFLHTFNNIFPKVIETFKPLAIVVQCGADGIKGDPLGQANLTPKSIAECIKKIQKLDLPTLYLGGGGYNFTNTARLWTYLTSVILNKEISNEIPDQSEFFTEYGPDYELEIPPGNMKDTNSKDYLCDLIQTVLKHCEMIKIDV